jgi:pyruvate,water dikinase
LTSRDAIHDDRPNDTLWSQANMSEAIPGVATPLTWSWWRLGFEVCNRRQWTRLGLLSRAEANRAADPRTDFVSIFYGRPVVNVDALRSLFARMPGGDAGAVERSFLGTTRPDATVPPAKRWRWPIIAIKLPWALVGLDRTVDRICTLVPPWWRERTSPGRYADVGSAQRGLAEAMAMFHRTQAVHGFVLMLGQLAFDRTAKICARAGRQDLLLALSASGNGTEETAVVNDLWRAARREMSIDDVIARHGFHGPDEGALHASSWREDPAPAVSLVERYRALGAPKDSAARGHRRAAEEELLAALPRRARWSARRALLSADMRIPRRERTKTAFLQVIDVGRAAARALGQHLHAEGLLDNPEDVFHLTLEEATSAPLEIDRVLIAFRRERRAAYERLTVPSYFQGTPLPQPAEPLEERTTRPLQGVAAGGGVGTGPARIILRAEDAPDLLPDEVLVCHTTDPGWVPFMAISAGVVVDVGGPLSHAAIVAREMGIPCVVGVGDATGRILNGDLLEVDGNCGTVSWRAGSADEPHQEVLVREDLDEMSHLDGPDAGRPAHLAEDEGVEGMLAPATQEEREVC